MSTQSIVDKVVSGIPLLVSILVLFGGGVLGTWFLVEENVYYFAYESSESGSGSESGSCEGSESGSGSESAGVTISLPDDVTIGNDLTVTNDLSVGGNATVTGNLTVNGTTTTVNSTTMSVDDKNIELGSTSSPSDSGASGGGITLKGSTDKTFNWIDSTDSWTSSEHIELSGTKHFRIDGVAVLSKTGLGNTVVNSVLTSVGTLSSGVWSATDIAVAHGGTGSSTASGARTNLGLVIGTNVEPHSDQLTELATMNANTASALADLTQTEVQIIDGLTTTTAELNKLDGATITTTELNLLDGITAIADEDDMSSNSATSLATQQSIKAYVCLLYTSPSPRD